MYNRPYVDINVSDFLPVDDLFDWIKSNKFKIMNIIGKSETKTNKMEEKVSSYLDTLFMNFKSDETK